MLKRLPNELVADIALLAQCNDTEQAFALRMSGIVDRLHACDPVLLQLVQRELGTVLYHRLETAPSFWQRFWRRESALPGSRPEALHQLRVVPSTTLLFLFHGDGFVREGALHALTEPLTSPFFVAAVLFRLNDWVPEVRAAALSCANRLFAITPAAVLLRGIFATLVQASTWGRWTVERAAIEMAFRRADVAHELVEFLCVSATGPTARLFSEALHRDVVDDRLFSIATCAKQPLVRAVALQTLVDGFARLHVGYEWKWIDKSMGQRKRVRVYRHREIQSLDRLSAARLGLADRVALVRRATLDAIARNRQLIPGSMDLLQSLGSDRDPAVRERVAYWQGVASDVE